MMRQILRADYEQTHLFPVAVEEWIGPQHAARFIREFVAQADLAALGIAQPNPEEGGVCFAPELLLSVWLYGYWRKIRTTRKLEEACANDLGFIWLSGNHRPDHQALWRFWHTNRERLRELFQHTVHVALKLELVDMVTQVVDGTKILAACSQWGRHDAEHNNWLVAKIHKVVLELEKQIEAEPAEELRLAELSTALSQGKVLQEKVQAALAQIETERRKHVHPQEPEARRMKTPGRNRFAYNAQIMVDGAQSVITAAEVVTAENDEQQLVPMMAAAAKITGQTAPETLADGGYSTAAQLAQAAQQSTSTVYTPLKKTVQNAENEPYHTSRFRWEQEKDVVICPQGHALKLRKLRQDKGPVVRVYQDGTVCAQCPVRAHCTTDRHGRSIDVGPHWAQVQVHRERMAQPESTQKMKRRGAIVERVFGQIKGHWNFQRWTAKGLTNARAQWDLLCSTWNLTRIFARWTMNGQKLAL